MPDPCLVVAITVATATSITIIRTEVPYADLHTVDRGFVERLTDDLSTRMYGDLLQEGIHAYEPVKETYYLKGCKSSVHAPRAGYETLYAFLTEGGE